MMRTNDFIFLMVNLSFNKIINENFGYAINTVYYLLLIIWIVYKIKTIRLEHEFRKRQINSYVIVRSSDDSVVNLGVEKHSCEHCRKIGGCRKLANGEQKTD